MPNVKSKSELRLMQAIVHGAKVDKGPSPEVAKEIIGNPAKGQYKNLPEKVGKKKK